MNFSGFYPTNYEDNVGTLATSVFVHDTYFFADTTERDSYFSAHPTELVDDLFVVVGGKLHQYSYPSSTWYDVSIIVRGEKGDDGCGGTGTSSAHIYDAAAYGSVKAAYDTAVAAFPAGGFTVHVSGEVAHGGSFTWSVRGALTGDSIGSSLVSCASGDTITITSQFFSCHDIEFKFATQATEGTVLKNVGGFYSDVHDVAITNPNIGFEYSGSLPHYSGRHVRDNIIMTNVRLYGDVFEGTHDVLTTNLYCIGNLENYPTYIDGSVGLKMSGWVEGCQFTNCTYLLFERTHDINGSNHNTITNCYFDSGKYAAALYNSNNHTIDNCWYSNGRGEAAVSGQGLVVYDSNNVTIAGSRMANCGSSGLAALNCDNLSLTGNVIANNSWDSANAYYGATIHDCNNIAVIGNQMSNTVLPGGATQINSLIFSGTNTGTALGNPSVSLINTTGINIGSTGGTGGGDVLAAGNNSFTGTNVFNGTTEFNSGIVDLNNTQGVSGQVLKSSGDGVPPQWTSLVAMLKTVGGVSLPGIGDISTFTNPIVLNNTLELNSGIIDLNNSQGVSGQVLKSSGDNVPPQWTSLSDMLKTINGVALPGTGNITLSGGGDVLAAGNTAFTGANVFNGTTEFNSGMIDLNNVQGVSGQIWKSSGANVAPQWTSLSDMVKTVGGESLTGTGNVSTFSSAMTFDSTIDLNSGIIDLNNSQGISGQVLKSSGAGVSPQWTSLGNMLKTVGGADLSGTGDITEFTSPMTFDSTIDLNSGIIDLNNTQGISGEVLKSSGNNVPPQWTSLGSLLKTVNGNALNGTGDIGVQPILVSGTNIKTVNGTSLLGSGNIPIASGGGDVYAASNNTFTGANVFNSTIEVNSGIIDLNNSQGVSGQIWKSSGAGVAPQWTSLSSMLKTINGNTLNGTGNIDVTGMPSGGSVGDLLVNSAPGVGTWTADNKVAGVTSSTDNTIVTFDGSTGKAVKDSGLYIINKSLVGAVDSPTVYEQKFTNVSTSSHSQSRISFENNVGGLGYYGIAGSNWSTYPPLNNGSVFFGAYLADFNIFTQTAGKSINLFTGDALLLKVSGNGVEFKTRLVDTVGNYGVSGDVLHNASGLPVWSSLKTINSESLLGSGNIVIGNVDTSSNNIFTGTNRFDGAVELNNGIIDLNNSQGISGQLLKSSGTGTSPQWTSISDMVKTVGGVVVSGSGDITTFISPMTFDSTIDLNSGIIDLNNTQGTSGQLLKSSGSGVAPQWTSIADLLKMCNGTEIAGTGDFVKHANGTGSIPSGSSTYTTTITHGLGFTPSAGEINITPTSAYGFAWQVGTMNSSTFTVVYSNNTQAFNFGWSVTRFNP